MKYSFKSDIFAIFSILLVLLGLGILIVVPSSAQIATASSVQVQSSYNGGLYYFWNRWGYIVGASGYGNTSSCYNNDGSYCGWALGVKDPVVTVNYSIRAFRNDTGAEILDGDTVPLGTQITFIRATSTSDVFWNAAGYSMDSPYGSLVANRYGYTFPFSTQGGTSIPTGGIDTYYDNAVAGVSTQGNPWLYGTPADNQYSQGPDYYAPSCTTGNGGFMGNSTASYVTGTAPNTTTQSNTFGDYAILDVHDQNYGVAGAVYSAMVPSVNHVVTKGDNPASIFSVSGPTNAYGPYVNTNDSMVVSNSPYVPSSIDYKITFQPTQGNMWYEYSDSRNLPPNGPGCYASSRGMEALPNMDTYGYDALGYFAQGTEAITNAGDMSNYNNGLGTPTSSANPSSANQALDYRVPFDGFSGADADGKYTFGFPAAEIDFNINYGTTTPPRAPTLTGPIIGTTSVSYTYTGSNCVSPGNYNINYGFDWNNDGNVDTWSPPSYSGSLPSGSSTQESYSWSTPGTYTIGLLCEDIYGAVSSSTPLTVKIVAPAPTLTFTFDNSTSSPQTYDIGGDQYPQLAWTTQYATDCSASGDWSGDQDPDQWWGYQPTITATGTYNYTLSCGGLGGTTTSSIEVNAVEAPPTLDLLINGNEGTTTDSQGNSDYVEWNTTNASSCTASGDWSGEKDPGYYQSEYVSDPNNDNALPIGTYLYTLTCDGGGGSITKTVELDVVLGPPIVDYCYAQSNSNPTEPNDPVTWSIDNVKGGTPPYTYSWTANDYDLSYNPVDSSDDPLNGSTDPSPTIEYSTTGYKGGQVVVTDSQGVSSNPTDCYGIGVFPPPPTVSIHIDGPLKGSVNTQYAFTVTGSSSDPNDQFTYYFYFPDTGQWDPEPSDYSYAANRASESDTHSWADSGDQTFYVYSMDTSSYNNTWTITPYTISIGDSNVPDVCSADVNPASTGQPVTWTVSTSSSTPSYSWTGTDGLSGALYQVTKSYSTVGTKSASVDVTSDDQDGNPVTHTVNCGSIEVNTGLPQIDLSGSTGANYTYGSVVLSKTTPLSVKLSVSNALSCSATGDSVWAAHVNGFDSDQLSTLSTTPDISGISNPVPNSETLKITCTNDNGSASATLHVGVLSITEF